MAAETLPADDPVTEAVAGLSEDDPEIEDAVRLPEDDPLTDEVIDLGGFLYAQHCAGCHGATGDGQGVAAEFLYPRPRDFRTGRFRLVSTFNGAPLREDLEQVLQRGMPGSSMPSYAHLEADERAALVDHVLDLYRAGAAQQYIEMVVEFEEIDAEEIPQEEVEEFVRGRTEPGEVMDVPQLAAADADTVIRGREMYFHQSCHSCHGDEGRGDGQEEMFDDEGFPTRPRDLTQGIFKGEHDPESLYRRVALGMPGSAMPGSRDMTPEQIADLVHFILSLSDEQTRQDAILRRHELIAERVDAIPADSDAETWAEISPLSVGMMPLWWRDGADPGLQVQAAHDGQTLALRLNWRDETPDRQAVGPDEFQDMLALQLFGGSAEPFLGMGGDGNPVELWQWRAGADERGEADHLLDDYPFDTPLYHELPEADEFFDVLTARAAGNPLAANRDSASQLIADGLGSTTFQPLNSQLVAADGSWSDGTWTVVLRRSLAVAEEEGVVLEAGQRYSLAFAVWDGSAADRAAQKLISVWHDLVLE